MYAVEIRTLCYSDSVELNAHREKSKGHDLYTGEKKHAKNKIILLEIRSFFFLLELYSTGFYWNFYNQSCVKRAAQQRSTK